MADQRKFSNSNNIVNTKLAENILTPKRKECYCRKDYKCLVCRNVCCDQAEILPCVCLISWKCVQHNSNYVQCYGSHS